MTVEKMVYLSSKQELKDLGHVINLSYAHKVIDPWRWENLWCIQVDCGLEQVISWKTKIPHPLSHFWASITTKNRDESGKAKIVDNSSLNSTDYQHRNLSKKQAVRHAWSSTEVLENSRVLI